MASVSDIVFEDRAWIPGEPATVWKHDVNVNLTEDLDVQEIGGNVSWIAPMVEDGRMLANWGDLAYTVGSVH